MADRRVNTWQIYAVRYARHDRLARENLMGGDPHDNSPMPIDYFVWGLISGDQNVVVDTGYDKSMAEKRGREFLRPPDDGLRAIGLDPSAVEDVIVTHMHYDHCGNHGMFPRARYHIQDSEMEFATGRAMTHMVTRFPFDESDVVEMVRRVYRGRVEFHSGDDQITPGLSVHHVGGHTRGMQVVRVNTRRGWVVLASDASHYYANIDNDLPYPITYNVAEVLEGYRRVDRLASSRDHVIPGHDPLVMERYPAPRPELEGWVARLD
jgi:glyoxylase-like metal-dependent hydrolase (beta-lactamase superfamily II)